MTEQELRKNTRQYVKDVLAIWKQKASNETIDFVADKVFHEIYPVVANTLSRPAHHGRQRDK